MACGQRIRTSFAVLAHESKKRTLVQPAQQIAAAESSDPRSGEAEES